MEIAPDVRRPVIAHHAVVSIHPGSRFADGAPDVASTHLSVQFQDGQGLTTHRETPVFPQDDGSFKLALRVPSDFADLAKDAQWSLVVVLPKEAELVSATGDADSNDRAVVAGRNAVTWTGTQDPDFEVIWRYLR